jgi:hypothetical protein
MAQIDPAVEAALSVLGSDEVFEVLVFPGPKGLAPLGEFLKDLQARGALHFTLLTTAGCASVRAKRPMLMGLAHNPNVSRITVNGAAPGA